MLKSKEPVDKYLKKKKQKKENRTTRVHKSNKCTVSYKLYKVYPLVILLNILFFLLFQIFNLFFFTFSHFNFGKYPKENHLSLFLSSSISISPPTRLHSQCGKNTESVNCTMIISILFSFHILFCCCYFSCNFHALVIQRHGEH